MFRHVVLNHRPTGTGHGGGTTGFTEYFCFSYFNRGGFAVNKEHVLCLKKTPFAGFLCFCFFAVLLSFTAALETRSQGLVLVDGGESLAPIVVSDDATSSTRRAASELGEYIEMISGVKPEMIEGRPEPVPPSAIWVGYQPAVDELLPDIDLEFEHPEEIVIAANTNHILIAGRDKVVAGVQQEYGTANAVYSFLQDYLDVRWIWPGETGVDIIKQDRIAFSPFEYRYHPQIRSRGGIFNYSRLGRGGGYGRSQEWLRLQRIRLDSLRVPAGHAFADWWNRFHETNPEYFALQPDGTRSGYPSPRTAKICKSHPDVWEQWMVEVEKQLEADPTQTVFDASANDSWASGYCVCEDCRAWDHIEGELRRFDWEGMAQQYVAMSDRQVNFANQLARKLKERYPDQDYYVRIAAYGHSRPAPVEAIPESNVIVSSVANFLLRPYSADRGSPQGTLHREQFEGWGEVAPNIVWRPNKARARASKPLVSPRQTIRDVRFVAENNAIGIMIDMVWEHWATRAPFYYVLAQMTWNPWQDGEAMLDDYYRRGFGDASEYIRSYWGLMEQKWEESLERNIDSPELFDADFFDRAYGYLDSAKNALENEPEIYSERINFLRMGLDYTRLVTEAREMMVKFNDTGDVEAENRAREIWVEEIKPLATSDEYPYAINWGPARPGHGHRTSGRYPSDLHQKW